MSVSMKRELKTNIKRTLSVILLLMLGFSQNAVAQAKHEVQAGETLYSIAKSYGISVDELKALNSLSSGQSITVGQQLTVPSGKAQGTTVVAAAPSSYTSPRVLKQKSSYRLAMLMPFYTDGGKSVDFYRGLLYGLSMLRKNGISCEVKAMNAGQSVYDIDKILASSQLDKEDIIFASGSEAVCNRISDYCELHDIEMLLPFSKAFDAVNENAHVVMASQPTAQIPGIYTACLKYLLSRKDYSSNAVICLPADIYQIWRVPAMLRERGVKVKGYAANTPDSLVYTFSKLKKDEENVILFLPYSGDVARQETYYNGITRALAATGKKVSTIIGPDAWKNFGTETRKTFYDNNVTLMTFSFINVYSSSYTAGRKFYIDTFGKVPDTDSQRMFFTGLDVAQSLFSPDGNWRPLCQPWKVEKAANQGLGLLNKGVRIVQFKRDKTVEISDYAE